jgi:CRISPR/Cas system CMR-associated protein Cmr1 (group 7 of RAMP superfamily)
VKSGGNPIGPSLQGAVFRISNAKTHINAWSAALEPYSDFRQGKDVGRNFGSRLRPGQSRWPEPGAIRNLLGLPAAHWDTNTKVELTEDQEMHDYFVGSDSDGGDFPKADFGLPILFQNMAGMEVGTRADGSKIMKAAELSRSAKDHTRFASPLIVKALAVTEARSVPISLMLNTPHVWELPEKHLTLKHPRYESVSVTTMPMREADMHWPKGKAGSFKRPPRVADEGVTSIRDAYLAYLTDEGWAGATLKPNKSE